MSETPSRQRTTPARRNHGRQTARSAAYKAYASENDAATLEANPLLNTPQTPNHVDVDPNTAPESSFGRALNSKNRSKNKSKSKHGLNSPDFPPVVGHTPPQRSVSIKASMSTAYAGATFHASPAPSALPLPSFLSKSPAESPVPAERGFTQVPSPPTTDQDVSTPFRPSSLPKVSESPLDFMFRAHREEKERDSRDKLPTWSTIKKQSSESLSGMEKNSTSKSRSLPHTRRVNLGHSSGGIDAAELDGTPGRPVGPAFSTPYQDRIKAARPATRSNHANSHQKIETSSQEPLTDDSTDALKKFLFGKTGPLYGGLHSAPSNSQLPQPTSTGSSDSIPRANEIRPGGSRGSKIEAMENDLRRILKLDVSSSPSSTDRIF
ncbi:hypothetical protein E4U42_004166 [Claviceps africana]|uniref:Proteophosphoglycan 5 n=1 Tax=Claviceps africana TaxID=83212 RepID=A0A8K0J5P9_9HYPO|nr:hypothetical protein E4U42_004166 [Claviceps africana]